MPEAVWLSSASTGPASASASKAAAEADEAGWENQHYDSEEEALNAGRADAQRLAAQSELARDAEDVEPTAAWLRIERPLRASDPGQWTPSAVVELIERANARARLRRRPGLRAMPDAEIDRLKLTAREAASPGEFLRTAVKALKSAGYDGIVYRNSTEDVGSQSWIVFDPE